MDKKILIVDNDPSIVKMIESFLTPKGFDVQSVSDGAEALKLCVKEAPHLVILDVMLPGIDGTEVARQLRKMEKTQNIPIIYVTALKKEGDLAGEDDDLYGSEVVLGKPFQTNELLTKINEMI